MSSGKRFLPPILVFAALLGEPFAAVSQPAAADPSPQPALNPGPEDIGDSMLVKRRYQEAIEAYRKVADASPDVWNKMGIAYQMLFDAKDAARCYSESLRLKPDSPRVLNNLATVYDSQRAYRKAERLYRKALRLDPRMAQAVINLGTNLLSQNRYKQGWAMYKRALALDPDVFDPAKAGSPVAQNDVKPARPGAMAYYEARGYAQAGMFEKAIKSLRRAIRLGFTNPAKLARDSTFAPLRENPAFVRLIAGE